MKEKEVLWKIPHNWTWSIISDLGDVVAGGTPPSKEPTYWGGNINWISPADLTGYTKKTIRKGNKSITEDGLKNSSAKVMPAGSVHFSSRAPIGYVVISAEPMATNQGFKSLVPEQGIFNEYVYYYLKASRQLAEKRASGTTFLELSGKAFGLLPIPVPPSNEQKRIVAKIEELFSGLENGIAALKTAREQLKVYRQAVLKHAFEGKLTAQWRKDNADKLESPEQLLARIQQEREARYQQQLEEWKAAVKAWEAGGKVGTKPGKPNKTKDISAGLVDDIAVPAEWAISTIGELNAYIFDGPFGSNLKTSDYVEYGVRVIRLENIGEMRFIEDKYSFISEEKYKSLSKHTVSSGDIIFSSFITEGIRVVLLPNNVGKAINKADCFCIRVFGKTYSAHFLALYLSSRAAYKQVESKIHGIGRPRINTTQLKSFVIPVCSMQEQMEILSEIDRQISEIDATASDIESQLLKAETLRQSILKKAFSGQLVPQDPSDEPASELLARIQAEKATKKAEPKAAGKAKAARTPRAKRSTKSTEATT